ncbi:hypothetical protein DYB32_010769 [Aphanomyces invadans]|uniref:Uncharacterized protein n=1 Tax=Aphanomyces invadans TaxID=157072 RepID=A0A418AF59_9STRA|nr:hypothetical protein DYB32_010769 [Aphanomyces invadans]
MEDNERPECRRNKKASAGNKPTVDSVPGVYRATSSVQSSIKSYTVPKVTGLSKQEFQKQIALNFFATGTSRGNDNTSANKKAWEALKNVYPSRFFQGYTFHGLHLLEMDIFAATKTKKGGSTEPTYPTDCLFEDMLLFINRCKDVVKFFHNQHVFEEKLEEMQKITGYCHQRKLHFTFEEAIAILEPIDALILNYQFDKVAISEVMPDFHKLPLQFSNLVSIHIIDNQELAYLCKKCVEMHSYGEIFH